MAAMADKDVAGVVAALRAAGSIRDATIVATTLDVPRALPAADLAAIWRAAGAGAVIAIADPLTALDDAVGRPGPTIVAGSLYLVGAARAHLIDDPELRDPPPGEAVP